MGVLWKPTAALLLLLHLVHSDSVLPEIDVEATGMLEDMNSFVLREFWSVCQIFSSSSAVD